MFSWLAANIVVGFSFCQSSRANRPSDTTLTPLGSAAHRPSGDAYSTPPCTDTMDRAEAHACEASIFWALMLAESAPLTKYGLPAVPTNSVWPNTPRPTMGNSVVIWYSSGQA